MSLLVGILIGAGKTEKAQIVDVISWDYLRIRCQRRGWQH